MSTKETSSAKGARDLRPLLLIDARWQARVERRKWKGATEKARDGLESVVFVRRWVALECPAKQPRG